MHNCQCTEKSNIEVIKTNVKYIHETVSRIDKRMDKLASKRELNIHRALLIGISGVLIWIFQYLITGGK